MDEFVLVVGASGGIGGATCRQLIDAGYSVMGTSRSEPDQQLLTHSRFSWARADITQGHDRERLVERVVACDAHLRGLVAASGTAHRGTVVDHDEATWEKTLRANVVGPALLLSGLARSARWSSPASVVFVGSLSARRALPDRALYGSTKAAIEQFARCAAIDLAPRSIYVNTVSVGVTDTAFLEGDVERLRHYVKERIPAQRMLLPDEVASAVLYCLSSAGSLVGASIDIDGGAGVVG